MGATPAPARGRVTGCLALTTLALLPLPAAWWHWPWVALALTAPVLLWGAWPVHRAALVAVRAGRIGVDALASLAVLAALGRAIDLLLRTPPHAPGPGVPPVLLLGAGCAVAVLALLARVPAAGDRGQGVLAAAVLLAAAAASGFAFGAAGPTAAGPSAAVDAVVAVLLAGWAGAVVVALLARPAGTSGGQAYRVRAAHPLPGAGETELIRYALALHAASRGERAGPPAVSDLDGSPETGLRGVVSELRRAGPGAPELLFPELARHPGEVTVIAHAVLLGPPQWLAAHGVAPPAAPSEPCCSCGTLCVAWDGVARGTLVLAPDSSRRFADSCTVTRPWLPPGTVGLPLARGRMTRKASR